MWVLEALDWALPFWQLDAHGIRPRSVAGLPGIVLAPFLHAGFAHLAANSAPFLALGGLTMLGGRAIFWAVTVWVILVGGGAVWLLAPADGIHLGASGLIFGYLGFLLSRGIFERSFGWTLVALAILVLYGGMVLGVLPTRPEVSWQGHLFGFASGIVAAWAIFPGGKSLYG